MGEQAKKIGEKLEGYGEKLFSGFEWTELTRDKEIKCTRKGTHKKRTHGIDLLMSFWNPYLGGKQGIIVECKNRKMAGIMQEKMNTWLNELINTIECTQSTEEMEDINLEDTNLCTGMLLVHANDKFDGEKFNSYLHHMNVPNRRNPINIFVAGNNEINRWNSLRDKILKDYSDNFQFVYPSIEGSNKELGEFITVNQLFSKYVFAQNIRMQKHKKNGQEYFLPITQKLIISFDEITKESFEYMWSMYKAFQFQDAEEMVFVFYPRTQDDVQYVQENFLKVLKQIKQPIKSEDEEKISIDFIDNRALSPIDTEGR